MTEANAEFYTRRMWQERLQSKVAESAQARAAHDRLAELYSNKLADLKKPRTS